MSNTQNAADGVAQMQTEANVVLAGGAVGVWWTIWALTSHQYDGPVYFFIPTIVLGVVGGMIGMAIDGAINKARGAVRHVAEGRPVQSQPAASASLDSAADEFAKLAGLLDRGLVTRDQFDLQRDRLLDVS